MLAGLSTSRSTATSGPPSSGPPRFDARLESAKKKLQDCLSCSSAKTPEGQRGIREAEAKVDAIRRQVEKASAEPRRATTADADRSTPTSADGQPAAPAGRVRTGWIDVYV